MFANMGGGGGIGGGLLEKNNLASDVCSEQLFVLPIGILMKPGSSVYCFYIADVV
jgi:hypothetical protein